MITNQNQAIFDSTDRSLSYLSKNPFSLISHLNSSSNLTKFQKISRKYLNSLWIRPLFTIIPLNSLLIPQIVKFGLIFDAIPREIDDLAVSSRQVLPALTNLIGHSIFFKFVSSLIVCFLFFQITCPLAQLGLRIHLFSLLTLTIRLSSLKFSFLNLICSFPSSNVVCYHIFWC